MSRHRSHVVQPLRFVTVAKAVVASAITGIVLAIIEPMGPLFAYILGV